MSYTEVSEYFATQLQDPLVQNDPKLKLWCLAANGYTDIQIDNASARQAWEELLPLARTLGEKVWEARALGELGVLAFLGEDTIKAQRMVATALSSAMASGDVGAQIRYLSMTGNAMNELKRHDEALEFFDKALQIAQSNKQAGYPFIALSGKASALASLNRRAEAQQLLEQLLQEARAANKHGQETELLRLLGNLWASANNPQRAIQYLESAAALEMAGQFHRLLGDIMIQLAKLYRASGDPQKAVDRTTMGLPASRKVGDAYYLPRYLTVSAELKAGLGETDEAEALYEEAQDIVNGMLANTHSLQLKSSLVAAMSETYLSHFNLEVERLKDVKKGFRILEQARGRAISDALRTRPTTTTLPFLGVGDVAYGQSQDLFKNALHTTERANN